MKNKLYLDTSIPSAYYDYSKPVRQLITQKWFENDSDDFKLYTSLVAVEEIGRMTNISKRENILELFSKHSLIILSLTEEARELGSLYLKHGAIPKTEIEDALHLAIATSNKIEFLASWNFKHIVSVNPIRKINEINQKAGYPDILIGSLELFGGYKYGNI